MDRQQFPDAYCLGSGEYFWGGASTHEARAQLMVEPIDADTLDIPSDREARLEQGMIRHGEHDALCPAFDQSGECNCGLQDVLDLIPPEAYAAADAIAALDEEED